MIGHDGSGIGDGWFVSHVRVEEPATKESLTFHCDRWLDKGEEDGKLEVELKPGSYKSSCEFGTNLCTTILSCKAKRQYLLTLQVSRYYIFALHSCIQ